MESNLFTKELERIQKEKEEIISNFFKNEDILYELMDTDVSWDYFIRSKFRLDQHDSSSQHYKKEEYYKCKEQRKHKKILEDEDRKNLAETTNGSRYYKRFEVKLGLYTNEKLENTYKDVAQTLIIDPNTIENIKDLDLILISNIDGIQTDKEKLLKIVEAATKKNIHIIFYDFNNIGKIMDYKEIWEKCNVLLTNSRKNLRKFKSKEKKIPAYFLEYAFNPIEYNPIGRYVPKYLKKSILFENEWDDDVNKRLALNSILQGAINSNYDLKINDRHFDEEVRSNWLIPSKYLPYVYNGNINSEKYLLKRFNFSIHFNKYMTDHDIINEDIYHALAMGNIVLTNYNPAINNKYPNVFIVNSKYEGSKILSTFTTDDINEIQADGIRTVFANDTSFDRFEEILNITRLNTEEIKHEKKVLVVGNEESRTDYINQSFKNKEFITWEELTQDEYNEADFVVFFSDEITYNEYYIEDLLNGFKYADVDYVLKSVDSKQNYTYTDVIPNSFLTMFDTKRFDFHFLMSNLKQKNISKKQGLIIDHTEYSFLKNQKASKEKKSYKLSVIVPIYNNGKYLKYKCFYSLKRSSIFEDMEIIFVDDGSSDLETIRIVDRLYNQYSNVKLYRFTDNGSGSASRPRNKGLELATCKYITYLDPDNEALNDGYAQLLNEIEKDQTVDMVVGNILRFDERKAQINYYKHVYNATHTDVSDDPFQLLKSTNLKVQSIQAMVIKKDILKSNNIKMVESAAGQDTLFFQEVMVHTKKIKTINIDIHLYYAAVSNSVTNTISKRFYEKYYKVEVERIVFLKENQLLDLYMEKKFNFYFVNWYLKRLTYINLEDMIEAIKILEKIYDMYKDYIRIEHPIIKKFIHLTRRNEYDNIMIELKAYFEEKN